jgi:hypothetical protein
MGGEPACRPLVRREEESIDRLRPEAARPPLQHFLERRSLFTLERDRTVADRDGEKADEPMVLDLAEQRPLGVVRQRLTWELERGR